LGKSELLTVLERVRTEQLALCDKLEEIADSLPVSVDRQSCIHTARALGSVIDRAHRMEEEMLFPLLRDAGPVVLDPGAMLERLKIEHAGDEYYAEELVEVLLSYGAGTPMHSAEVTGYMLRGFFESVRRHVAFEHAVLGPMFSRAPPDTPPG
jgi:hemerythrin-like domain-containing protein